MTKKFAIVLALFVISIVCCAGCIGPGDNEDPEIPDVPDVPDVPVTPVDPVDPVVPVEEYSVMFMLNYGDAGAYTAETVKAGETVSKPATPTRSGYTFKGWFTAAEGGVEYDFTQAVNADVTLYAQWKKKSSSSSGGHSHNWGTGSVTTPATCVAEGVKTYTCSCGQTKTEVISATGQHSYGDWNSGVRTCIVCTTATETCQHPTTQVSGADVVCTICTMTIGQLSTMVAEINGNYYGSFASAMDNAADDDTIKLLATVTGGEVTKKVVIDTNDNETSLKYDDGVLEIDDIKIVCSTASDLGTVMFGDEEVVFVVDGSDNYVSGSDGNLIVAYTKKDTTYTVYTDSGLQMALDAANENAGEYVVNLAVDITDDVTVEQKPNVKITIDGKDKKFNGAITVDGKSNRYDTAFLTIQNVNFASDSISAAAFVNLGKSGDTNTRYVHGVTVKDCTFTYSGVRLDVVAVKSYTGGDLDLVLNGCKITTDGMHSLLQVKNVESGLQVINCEVADATEGLNLNSCYAVEMSNCIISADLYAVRFGEGGSGGVQETFSISDCTLTSTADTGSAIIFRGAADNAELTLTRTTLDGATKISGATANTKITIDGVPYVTLNTGATQNDFNTAVSGAVAGQETTISLPAGTYSLPSMSGKDVTIVGDESTIINLAAEPNVDGSDVTFVGVTVKTTSSDNHGIQHCGNIVYEDCKFDGSTFCYGESVTFKKCEFKLTTNYIWTYGAKEVLFDTCNFNTNGKAILVYKHGDNLDGPFSQTVTIKDCKFDAGASGYAGGFSNEPCAAVEIDSSMITGTYTVKFEGTNTVATGTDKFSSLYRVKKGADKNNVIVYINGVQETTLEIATKDP